MSIDHADNYSLPLNTNGLSNQVYYMNRVWLIYVLMKWLSRAGMVAAAAFIVNLFVQTINDNMTKGFTDGWDLIVFLFIVIFKTFWALTFSSRGTIFWSTSFLFAIFTYRAIPVHKKQLVLYRFNPKRSPVVETHVFTIYSVYGRTAIGIETRNMNRVKRFITYALFEPEIYLLKNPIPNNPMDTSFLDWSSGNGLSVEIEKAPCFFVDDFEHSGAIIELVRDEETGEIQADLSMSSIMSLQQLKFINEWPDFSVYIKEMAKDKKRILELERQLGRKPFELAFQFHAFTFVDPTIATSKRLLELAKEPDDNYNELVGRQKKPTRLTSFEHSKRRFDEARERVLEYSRSEDSEREV